MSDIDYAAKIKSLSDQINQSKAKLSVMSETAVSGENTAIWWSVRDAMTISSFVLIFGLIICFLASRLLSKGRSADSILKTLGTVLIIICAVFLVVAGYSDKQISPVIGLLGTIVGYLLGRNTNEPKV